VILFGSPDQMNFDVEQPLPLSGHGWRIFARSDGQRSSRFVVFVPTAPFDVALPPWGVEDWRIRFCSFFQGRL